MENYKSGRDESELEGITKLGSNKTEYKYDQPDYKTLETFVNKHPDRDYLVSFKAPEFTSLCPKTGQPDFATIYIDYIPDERLVESKSLKLYLFSYRNHGDFHEDCTNKICDDIVKAIDPKWIRVIGDFMPRGGISITTIAEQSKNNYKPKDYYLTLKDDDIHNRHKS